MVMDAEGERWRKEKEEKEKKGRRRSTTNRKRGRQKSPAEQNAREYKVWGEAEDQRCGPRRQFFGGILGLCKVVSWTEEEGDEKENATSVERD